MKRLVLLRDDSGIGRGLLGFLKIHRDSLVLIEANAFRVGSDIGFVEDAAREKIELLIVQDIFENELTAAAKFVLPACAWVEREGSFTNIDGLIQPFERAIDVPDGAKRDGQYLFELAGFSGLYRAAKVRQMMAEAMPLFAETHEATVLALHAH